MAISAGDIEKNKVRGDLGIPYEEDVLRLIDVFRGLSIYLCRPFGAARGNSFSNQPGGFSPPDSSPTFAPRQK